MRYLALAVDYDGTAASVMFEVMQNTPWCIPTLRRPGSCRAD